MKKLGVLFIHGIGVDQNVENSLFKRSVEQLTNTLTSRMEPGQADQVIFKSVIWQQLIQVRQTEIFNNVKDLNINGNILVNDVLKHARTRGIKWTAIKVFRRTLQNLLTKLLPAVRGILVSTLGDAAAVEHRASEERSVYTKIQRLIRDALESIYDEAGQEPIPVIIVSHSYGGHLISNYIWDSSRHAASGGNKGIGIWKYEPMQDTADKKKAFLQCNSLVRFFSTANNIALFISGMEKIIPIDKPHPEFKWYTYWDKNDVMGWPLKELHLQSHDPQKPFDEIIHKEEILSLDGIFTHNDYWTQQVFIDDLSEEILTILQGTPGEELPL